MKYVSTRGEAAEIGFEDAMLAGLATDGGLYVPKDWPRMTPSEFAALRGRPYPEIAEAVISRFTDGAIPAGRLRQMLKEAYAEFRHPAVVPLKQLDSNLFLLELFHGPTLAFKDVAMQILARMMDFALEGRGATATIVGATSGDTGSAAIEAFKIGKRTSIFILHPHGRVSEVQRRQMTTVDSPSVHNIALEGSFDDCQAILKTLFGDARFRDQVHLSGVNSINWARIVAQIVYYVSSALSLGAPDRAVSFCVPTGNFGDIFAGFAAKRMGLPIDRLVIATNINDILDRAVKTGRYEVHNVLPTTSPSMDIQVSSNFERLLFEASGRNAAKVRGMMASLAQSRSFTLDAGVLDAIRAEFDSSHADEATVARTISETHARTGELLDPHSAIGVAVAGSLKSSANPMVSLATAHPAKFPDAVEKASGIRPALPERLAYLMSAEEKFSILPNDLEAVKTFILARSAT
ncbi:MAG: threonine synthase [Rhizobiales bacterium]|nr:threonine synthase [Hyphomicrobiales bacterium]